MQLTIKFLRTSSETLSLQNTRLFVAAVLLSVVPLSFGPYLPMVDIPGHAAVVTALRELSAGNEAFAELFEADWFTPYLLGYVLIYVLGGLMPLTVAIKLVVIVAIASVPLLTAVLLRAAGADARWRWLAIPCSYSFAFYWGFLSYLVAVPFAVLLLVFTVRFAQDTTLRNGAIVAILAVFLFFAHVIVMGLACLYALLYLAGLHYQTPRGLPLLFAPYTAPLPLVAAWLIPRFQNEAGIADAPVIFGALADRLQLLGGQPAGMEYLSWAALAITASMVVLPPLTGGTLSRRPERWLPFAVTIFLFMTIPAYAFETGFMYERLGVFLVPLWFLMWDAPSSSRRSLDRVAIPIVILWLFMNTGRFASFARETQHFDEVVEAMAPGKRVASMIVDRGTPLFRTPVYLHFGAWYQTLKTGVVDFNFADFRLVLRRKHSAEPRVDEELSWFPNRFEWERHGGDDYDYFLVKAPIDVAEPIFKTHIGSVRLVRQSGGWWLYENTARP